MLAQADLRGKVAGLNSVSDYVGVLAMDEEDRKKPRSHEVGMVLDALSVEELQDRIVLLEQEVARIRAAMEAKDNSRRAAEAAFKF